MRPRRRTLPALHEAVASGDPSTSATELPALPALEIPPGNDPAVQPASARGAVARELHDVRGRKQRANGQVKDRLSKGQHQIEQAIEGAISSGQQQIEQAIDDSLDDQLRKLGGLESAPRKGPK